MIIRWTNPQTGEQERIRNFYSPGSAEGLDAILLAKRHLARRFGQPVQLRVEDRPGGWDSPCGCASEQQEG
jgi:hypothetical protein